MRLRVALAVAVSLSWMVPLSAAQRVIPTDWVRRYGDIRESPSAERPITGRLERDEVATLLDSVPRWYKIEIDGMTGFVSKSWTDVILDLDPRKLDELRILADRPPSVRWRGIRDRRWRIDHRKCAERPSRKWGTCLCEVAHAGRADVSRGSPPTLQRPVVYSGTAKKSGDACLPNAALR